MWVSLGEIGEYCIVYRQFTVMFYKTSCEQKEGRVRERERHEGWYVTTLGHGSYGSSY